MQCILGGQITSLYKGSALYNSVPTLKSIFTIYCTCRSWWWDGVLQHLQRMVPFHMCWLTIWNEAKWNCISCSVSEWFSLTLNYLCIFYHSLWFVKLVHMHSWQHLYYVYVHTFVHSCVLSLYKVYVVTCSMVSTIKSTRMQRVSFWGQGGMRCQLDGSVELWYA